MELSCPTADPHFAKSHMHGTVAQSEFLRKVFPYCTNFRTAVDVGAHIGLCTSVLVGKFERIWAFEPQAENYACLKANVAGSAILENVAIGGAEGDCAMVLDAGGNSGMWRVEPDAVGVEMRTLDSYHLENVDLVKIDTEGFEGLVVQGATQTIFRCHPVIVFEDNGLGSKYYGTGWVDPKVVLRAHGYQRKVRLNKDEVWALCK